MQDHRNLRVWKHAHDLAVDVRGATSDFPGGYASIQSQMVRAAESIVFNIAEGCGASSQREFARFLGISIKSSFELEAQCELAKDYGVLRATVWQDLAPALVSLRRMLFAFAQEGALFPSCQTNDGALAYNHRPVTGR